MILSDFYNSNDSSGLDMSIFRRKGGGGGGGGSGGGSGGGGGGGGHGGGSGGGKGSSSSSSSSGGTKGSFSTPSSGKGTFSASSSSRGGGPVAVVASGSLFSGRLSGGASRDQVYGNSRIGSGYPYGAYGTFYGGRPFPYAFYPIFIVPGYYGGDEYGPSMNGTRPGGSLSTAIVQPLTLAAQNSYYLIGDESSVSVVLASLVSSCGIANFTVTNTYINGTSDLNGTALVPHPEQIVQYYRASSFALALSSYNNSVALLSRAPASNDSAPPPLSEDMPLPVGINMTLLTCLNTTIAATVPLVDTGSGTHGLGTVKILQIVIGTLAGVLVLLILCSRLTIRKAASYITRRTASDS